MRIVHLAALIAAAGRAAALPAGLILRAAATGGVLLASMQPPMARQDGRHRQFRPGDPLVSQTPDDRSDIAPIRTPHI
jgi:hypothetical protein